MKITKIDVLSAAKIQAVLMAAFGLVMGIFMTIVGALISSVASAAGAEEMAIGGIFGFMGLIIIPLMYGIIGFITGAITAFLYNLAAKWVGGLKIEVEMEEKQTPASK